MIHCQKCNTQNPPTMKRCRQCGANLLPGEGFWMRVVYLFTGMFGGLFFSVLTYVFFQYPEKIPEFCPGPIYILLAAVIFPLVGFAMALQRTPPHTRYENRAKRHIDRNPAQAAADFSQALTLAPEKVRIGLLKQRAQVYEKMGLQKEATRDVLAMAMDPAAYKNEALFVKYFGADDEVYTASRAKDTRRTLLSSGKAIAVGYCPKCKDAVELTIEERCPKHKSKKGENLQLVLPDEIEAGKQIVRQARQQNRRQRL